jgi:Malectin domain
MCNVVALCLSLSSKVKMEHLKYFILALSAFFNVFQPIPAFEVAYAVNLGGDEFIDSESIRYRADTNSDGGFTQHNGLNLTCAKEVDRKLYEDVHYSNKTFGYDLPARRDGHYALVLKFSTTNPTYPGGHEFDVLLDQQFTILSHVNHEKSHGRYCAYDEFVYFSICDGNLLYKDQSTLINGNGKIRIDFRPIRNNIHVSALLLLRGVAGEKLKLSSSNSNDTIYFDPLTPSCQRSSRIIRAIVNGANASNVELYDRFFLITINYFAGLDQ